MGAIASLTGSHARIWIGTLVPTAVACLAALWFAFGFHADISTVLTEQAGTKTVAGARASVVLADGTRVWIDKDGTARWHAGGTQGELREIAAEAGRPWIVPDNAGALAFIWEDRFGANRIGFLGRIGDEILQSILPLPVFTTAVTPLGEGRFAVGGLDGRVRIADFTTRPTAIVEPGPGAIHIEGLVAFLSGTADGRFRATGRDGRPFEGSYDGERLGDLRLSSVPLPGAHAVPIPYAGDAPTVPRADQARLQAFRDCAVCPEMIALPGGEFTMGSAGERRRPRRRRRPAASGFSLEVRNGSDGGDVC